MPDHRDEILSVVNHPDYRPVKPKQIAKRIGLLGDAAESVRKTVKRMVKEGQLAYGSNHLVLPVLDSSERAGASPPPAMQESGIRSQESSAATVENPSPSPSLQGRGKKSKHNPDHIVGTFRRMDAGFGFVRPDGTQRSEGRDADIFIPANAAGDAASGDTVSVKMSSRTGRGGKTEGRIIDVVSRATNTFVGTYFEQGGMGMVQIDGKIFTQPVDVGDPGAKGVQPDDKVVLEMVRFPSHARDGEGVIVEILGQRGMPGVDTLSIIHEFGLPGPFAEDALEEARRQAELFDQSLAQFAESTQRGQALFAPQTPQKEPVPGGRRDLTRETIITIDPATARDFDDAISLTKLENGHWLLGVHIADVSHFVQPKSPLDREAKDRATSVYLPDRVIPMLPEVISNNLASLQPDRVRYAITARIEFTEDGLRIGADVFKSAIKSCRRFAYEEVDEYLLARGLVEPIPSRKSRPDKKELNLTPEVDALLERMFTLAMKLRERRFRRGALELSMPELEIDLDHNGQVTGAHLAENTESHQIIEEFMLAANEAVAETLRDADLYFLRRVHGAPDPRKLKSLTAFVGELGIKTESLESRFALQKLLDDVKGDPREHAINYATLRSMQRAVYSPEEEGHFALASDCYCHFTSPIRRYPDLTIHRLIEALAAGRPPQQELERLFIEGDHCSEREQRAAEAERELKKVKLLNYLADKIGMEMNGVITGVESFGMFVTGSELPAEGFVPLGAITDDFYRYDRAGHVIHGMRMGNSYRLGDPVRIAVAAVDVDRRQLDFRLLGRQGKSGDISAQQRAGRRSPTKTGKKNSPRKGGKKRR
jgi:ribonuclease R